METFPELSNQKYNRQSSSSRSKNGMTRPRRKSSGLGADIRGDTGAPAMSTLEPMPTIVSPPLSPSISQRNSDSKVPRTHSKRRKARSLFRRWRDLSFKHTWVNPLILTIAILSLYLINPTESNPLNSAIFLSYPLPPSSPLIPAHTSRGPDAPTQYGKGPRDFAFVAFYTVVLSFTREFLMQRVIRPLAIYCGIRSRSKQSRFMEQVYTAMYFSVFGPFGLYVMSRTPVWYFNTAAMFETYPHRSHEGLFKVYYLLQASYWAQQAIVLMLLLEKPRKDFKELVGHHIVTLALIWLSYRFHFTYMGLAVYITHDISDLFLATSKTLNYLNSPLTVPYFSLFMCVWLYLRHYLNLVILYATITTFSSLGPFTLDWETQQYKCWISQYITFGLLASLQALNLFWLFLIVRIAFNIVFRSTVEDVRSDDDDTDDEAEKKEGVAQARSNAREAKTKQENRNERLLEAKMNGNTNGSARRKPGESYADAVKEEKKVPADKKRR
ncbi:hypothetical protein MMC34_000218 [Xylographa carneopallida]|nr:hypothetical protein [Xylographa carneopallida]